MVKINQFELENVKRIKAVKIEPSESGLTIIGGRNNQGKTSVLDSLAWALGGDRYRPSQASREGSVIPPRLHVVLSNGLIVDRSGKNGDLKVIDPDGHRGGQQLLNEFIEQLALDLPRFMRSSNKEKASTLLQIIGVEDQLLELDRTEQELYNRRHAIGQIADQKSKYAKEQAYYSDAPKEPVSASELIRQQQDILARNGENQRKRQNLDNLKSDYNKLYGQVEDLKARLEQMTAERDKVYADVQIAQKDAVDLHDESTEELERNINDIETINRKVRANLDKERAEADSQEYKDQYDSLTAEIDGIRQRKSGLLHGAKLPLEGLSVEDGELTFNGMRWDNMSGSDQLKVSTAIVRAVNPKCGFILLDKLEQMDLETLNEFGEWMESQGLQGIATRVSTGGECSIIIEDGYAGEPHADPDPSSHAAWKAGEF